jgi:serine/threonine protein kinase/tetratricopeptide (TPR) repeat protein
MASEILDEKAIFNAARQIGSPDARAEYLRQACGTDSGLRERVQVLLRAYEEQASFLESPPPVGGVSTIDQPASESPGTVIGPYKLVEPIGEGGMGAVWMAQQTEPVKRLVALKLIKPGMDSKQVIARFEAERQALALMDHPNIAKVLDGGTTDAGRPYFVMDLVKGVPITKYCDEHRLTPHERLELFLPVCQAVQHAHQKGIIHRDLKPSNVLVALYDDKPVPKVIDFGVAKAVEQRLTEQTLVTGFGNIVGTPEYMSPEQAQVNQLDVDTRSDVYSLGVLLYELLAGSPPFTRKELGPSGMLEMLRVIREQEPTRPSAKLSTAEGLPTLAANRGTEPAKLARLVRGELDWIVMKALEKDRNRRYESGSAFAADVQRHLHDEPVLACPPSAWYRFRKLVRRNRGRLTAASVIGLALLIAIGTISWGVQDRLARGAVTAHERQGRQGRLTARVDLIREDVKRLKREQKWREALTNAQRAEAALASGEADETTQEGVRDMLQDLTFVVALERIRLDRATILVEGKFNHGGAAQDYARAFRQHGVDVEKLPAATAVARLKARTALVLPLVVALDDWAEARRVAFGMDDPGWKSLVSVARGIDTDPLRHQLRDCWGDPITPQLQARLRRLAESVDVRAQSPATLFMLGRWLGSVHLTDSAIEVLRDSQFVYPGDFWLNSELASQLLRKGDAEAIRYLSVAVSIRPDSVSAQYALAHTLSTQGKPKEAAACYRKVIDLDRTVEGAHYGLGQALRALNKPDEAVGYFRKAIDLAPTYAAAHYGLGQALCALNKHEEAIPCFDKAIELAPTVPYYRWSLGMAWYGRKQLDKAIACFRKAIEIDPKYPDGYDALGAMLVQKGLREEAAAVRREHARLKPSAANFRTVSTMYGIIGRWDVAATEGQRAAELEPDNAQGWYLVAVSQVGAGNVEGYRRACREMIKRFGGGTGQAQAAERTASACLLLPNELDAADYDRVQKLAGWAVTGTEKDASYRSCALTKGLAEYRAGRHKEAVEWLRRYSPKAAGHYPDATAFAVLALAQHRLGRTEDAQAALSRAQSSLAAKMPDPRKGYAAGLYSQILCREAKALLEKKGGQ